MFLVKLSAQFTGGRSQENVVSMQHRRSWDGIGAGNIFGGQEYYDKYLINMDSSPFFFLRALFYLTTVSGSYCLYRLETKRHYGACIVGYP